MEKDNYSVTILPQAESDITDILDYIANDLCNPTAASNLWIDIKDAIGRARMFPLAMPVIKNKKITLGEEYRRIDVDNYVIVYKIYEALKEIRIFAVLYGPSNVVSKILNRI
jgi:plasmid stabilization system protein ParE